MGYNHFRFARRIDADTTGIYTQGLTKLASIKSESATLTSISGKDTTGDDIKICANTTDTYPYIKMNGTGGINIHSNNGSVDIFNQAVVIAWFQNGSLKLKETTTPTATADMGAIYTKNDNKLYFQDGAGTEHTVAFV